MASGARCIGLMAVAFAIATCAGHAPAKDADELPMTDGARADEPVEVIEVRGRRTVTATSTTTLPAESFELRPLESGGQMLEVVPNLLTAQHTGGGKAEQYFLRGFDADHGTDLAVYFDGVPINLRSHAHGQGFLDLHFVTRETIQRVDAYKGPYFVRFGDFATAATVEYVPFDSFEESFVRLEGGAFDTFRAVAGLSPRSGVFEHGGPAKGFLAFEAYHTNGPFQNDEDLWRYSLLARGGVELAPGLRVSGHALGYYADWKASGLIPEGLVDAGLLSPWASLDPTEGGDSTRAQGKLQLDWSPSADGRLTADAYLAYYDLELFSNFTYFLVNDDPDVGDGIVQRDQDRLYTGGRIEYAHFVDTVVPARLLAGIETRYDDVDIALGTQTRRTFTGCRRGNAISDGPCAKDRVHELSVEPYLEVQLTPLEWVQLDVGLRFAWFRFDGVDPLENRNEGVTNDTLWLPKANLVLSPFSIAGPWASAIGALRELELFVNFGVGYHSNDARAVFEDPGATALPRATGVEVGLRTRLSERIELALDWWYLNLEDEFVFIGDEGTTEAVGETDRHGIEFVTTLWLLEWLYLRGDLAYTDARLADSDRPVPQAPRFVAKGALGARWQGLAAEIAVRHLGDRYASEAFSSPKLSGYTVLDLGARYRWRFLELGLAVENLTDTDWRSSEFFYQSRPVAGGLASEDFHFTPGNPRNVRGWIAAHF